MKPRCSVLVLGTLFLTGGLRAQIPAPSTQAPIQPGLPRSVPAVVAPNPAAPINPGLYSATNRAGRNIATTPRSSPIPAASPTHNSIIVPSDNDTNAPDLAIEP